MHIHACGKIEQSEGEQSLEGPRTASLYSFLECLVAVSIIGVVDPVFPMRYSLFRSRGRLWTGRSVCTMLQDACGSGILIFLVFKVPAAQEQRYLRCFRVPAAQECNSLRCSRVPVAQKYRYLWCSRVPVAQEYQYLRCPRVPVAEEYRHLQCCKLSLAQEYGIYGIPGCL